VFYIQPRLDLLETAADKVHLYTFCTTYNKDLYVRLNRGYLFALRHNLQRQKLDTHIGDERWKLCVEVGSTRDTLPKRNKQAYHLQYKEDNQATAPGSSGNPYDRRLLRETCRGPNTKCPSWKEVRSHERIKVSRKSNVTPKILLYDVTATEVSGSRLITVMEHIL
jgi:hypothetical protein